MANKRKKQSQTSVRGTILVLILVVVIAVVFAITSGGRIYKSSAANQTEIEDNVKALAVLEEKEPTNFKQNRPGKIVDMEAEQAKILAMRGQDYDGDAIKRWYQGTAVIGDSITLRTGGYGFLDFDVIFGEVGANLNNCDDVLNAGIAVHPYVVFLCFGGNDITGYGDNAEMYVEKWDETVQRVKEALPEAVIYIDGVLPEQPGNPNVNSNFQYRELMNDAVREYCEGQDDVHYIDSDFILDNNTDLYDDDGIHPTGEFFPMWLTYMADMAGLSDDFTEEETTAEEGEEPGGEAADGAQEAEGEADEG